MSNSSLVNYTKISPNSTNPRNDKIKKITIHHMAGNLSVEACGNIFADPTREGSSNYGIGTDGRVGMYVEEKNRSWCSSNRENDHQAITIEVANDGGAPDWHVSDKALNKLVELCVDICKRNGIERLNYTGDVTGNLTMHKWFAATGCPGPYLESKFPWIAEQVNKQLGATANTTTVYRIRKTWEDAESQIGAYKNLEYAKNACDDAGKGYYVFDETGKAIYPAVAQASEFKVGDEIKLVAGAKYTSGKTIPSWVFASKLYLRGFQGNNVLISTVKTGAITGVVAQKDITKAESTTPTTKPVEKPVEKPVVKPDAPAAKFTVGETVKLSADAKYTSGKAIPKWLLNMKLYVRELQGDNVVISTLKSGAVTGVVHSKYLTKVSTDIAVGDKVKVVSGAKYATGQKIPAWLTVMTLYARELQGDNVVVSTNKTGAITGVIAKKDLKKV